MKYETDNELKYTTLQIRATLDLKKMNEKAKKKNTDANPPMGGWGMGSKEPIQKIFLLTVVTISEN